MALRELSPKQIIALNDSDAFVNIYEGAVRSGKSYVSLIRFMEHVRNGPEEKYVVCGKSERTIMMNVIDPLQSFTGGIIRYNRGMGVFYLFGKKVYVVGANDERAEGKIRGPTFAGALVDEATLLPEGFFRMLLSRLTIDGAKLFATTNPDSPFHWLKHEFIDVNSNDQAFLKTFKFVIDDNPSLSQSKKNELKRSYQGLFYKRFIEGQWVLAEGAIFDFFDHKTHVVREAITYAKYWILGVDYGTTNPFAACLIGFNDDHHPSIWVEREYYWDSKTMGHQKTDMEYAEDIKRVFNGYPLRSIYLDPAAASFEVELRRHKMPVKQAKNDVLDGIRFVSNLFTAGDLVIKKDCLNLIKEIEGYVWDSKSARDGVDRPIKVRDHAVDAMRYALFTHWGHKASLKETPEMKPINPMNYTGYGPNSWGWQKA
jgi:PBSX family phage terminase large subunit